MLSAALKEINDTLNAKNIEVEKGVFINGKYFAYDIFLKTEEGARIGFEILARPTKGKMKQKLVYATGDLDRFIFILPSNFLQFYMKQPKYALSNLRPHFFGKCFDLKNLYVWLYGIAEDKIIKTNNFSDIFNVEKS